MALDIVKKFIPQGGRGKVIGRNVIGLFILQGIGILTSFLLVPLTIDYVSSSQYGIWLTISSIVGWLSLVDVGLGAGLRNRLTEALANCDTVSAKKYVSTTYLSLTCIVAVFWIAFIACYRLVDWSAILNQPEETNSMLTKTMFIVVSFFALRLVVQLIGIVLTAHLKTAAATAISTVSNVIVLLIIWMLSKYTDGDIMILALVMSAVPVLGYLVMSAILFSGRYRAIAPSFKFVDNSKIRSLLGLGVGFFIIKISMIVLFQASNIIIIQLYSNEDVVVYNISYKLFSMIFILYEILIQPFWTGYTDAWVKKDYKWIEDTMNKLLKVWRLIAIGGLLMLLCSPIIYRIWIGNEIKIPYMLSITICIYFISHCYGGTYNMFINGVGKLRLQLLALIFVMILYIPVVLLFANGFHLGVVSIPLALIISDFYSLFLARLQYKKLLKGTAHGIWNK